MQLEIKTVIGVDQSYARTGISVARKGKLIVCESYNVGNFRNNTHKRAYLSNLLKAYVVKYQPEIVVVERARTFSHDKSRQFVSTNVIKAFGTMISMIVDSVYPIPVYSVDTRSWKSKVLGKASASKEDAVRYIAKIGFANRDHDAADSAGLALYPFCKDTKMKEER